MFARHGLQLGVVLLTVVVCHVSCSADRAPRPPQAAAGKPAVSGTVVDEQNRPVAGVLVEGLSWGKIVAATSDSEGKFALVTATIDRTAPRLQVYAVRATHKDGRLGAVQSTNPIGQRADLKIVLKPPKPLKVRVIDADDNPVPAASVIAKSSPAVVWAEGKTDAKGGVERFLSGRRAPTTSWAL